MVTGCKEKIGPEDKAQCISGEITQYPAGKGNIPIQERIFQMIWRWTVGL